MTTTATAPTTITAASRTDDADAPGHQPAPGGAAARRLTGWLFIAAFSVMVAGTIAWASAGADIDAALIDGTMDEYVQDLVESDSTLVLNLSLWIAGTLLFGAAGVLASRLGPTDQPAGHLARYAYTVAVPIVAVSYVTMLGLVHIAPQVQDLALAEALAFIGSHADWIATMLILGAGPALLAIAGRGTWVPTWLARGAVACAAAALLTAVSLYTETATSLGFVVIPVGMVWSLAAGITLVRSRA